MKKPDKHSSNMGELLRRGCSIFTDNNISSVPEAKATQAFKFHKGWFLIEHKDGTIEVLEHVEFLADIIYHNERFYYKESK